jgi:hypothetical protein
MAKEGYKPAVLVFEQSKSMQVETYIATETDINGTRMHNVLHDSYLGLSPTSNWQIVVMLHWYKQNRVNICTHAMKKIHLAELK